MKHSIQTQSDSVTVGKVSPSNGVLLNKIIYPNDKIFRLAKLVDWELLEDELGFLFTSENSPPLRLVLGMFYLQSIENLSFEDVIKRWTKTPEWQYFCGQEYMTDEFPLHNASLSIWSRVIGSQGRDTMIGVLVSLKQSKKLH